jgi:hypothetical protein
MKVFAKFVRSVIAERSTNGAIWLIWTALLNVRPGLLMTMLSASPMSCANARTVERPLRFITSAP